MSVSTLRALNPRSRACAIPQRRALALEVELRREQVETMADAGRSDGGSLHEASPDLILTGEAWR